MPIFQPMRPTSLQFLETITVDLVKCKELFGPLKHKDENDWNLAIDSLNEANLCMQNEETTGGCFGEKNESNFVL